MPHNSKEELIKAPEDAWSKIEQSCERSFDPWLKGLLDTAYLCADYIPKREEYDRKKLKALKRLTKGLPRVVKDIEVVAEPPKGSQDPDASCFTYHLNYARVLLDDVTKASANASSVIPADRPKYRPLKLGDRQFYRHLAEFYSLCDDAIHDKKRSERFGRFLRAFHRHWLALPGRSIARGSQDHFVRRAEAELTKLGQAPKWAREYHDRHRAELEQWIGGRFHIDFKNIFFGPAPQTISTSS